MARPRSTPQHTQPTRLQGRDTIIGSAPLPRGRGGRPPGAGNKPKHIALEIPENTDVTLVNPRGSIVIPAAALANATKGQPITVMPASQRVSVIPDKSASMTFSEALVLMREGRRVRRHQWKGSLSLHRPSEGESITEPYIVMHDAGRRWQWSVNQIDLLAEDWEIVE